MCNDKAIVQNDVSPTMQDNEMIDDLAKETEVREKFSVARWLCLRSDKELNHLSQLSAVKKLSDSEGQLIRRLMEACGFAKINVSPMMIIRYAQRLGIAASAEYCFRMDWAEIKTEMTLRKDPRKSIRVLPLGRAMKQVMKGSPLISAIDDWA